jgi:hypothetical protein
MNRADIDNNDLRTKSGRKGRSLIRTTIDVTHFFKKKRAETTTIIKKRCTGLRKIQNDEEWECFYEAQAASLEPKPYPSLEAVRNVFALALKRNPESAEFNPSALWDLYCEKLTTANISTGCTGKCSVVKGRIAHQGKISKYSLNNSPVVFLRIDF